MTARQLAFYGGLSYDSLLSLLPKWARWRYVRRQKFPLLNSPQRAYGYKLADRGWDYVAAHEHEIPWERFENEMEKDRKARGYT